MKTEKDVKELSNCEEIIMKIIWDNEDDLCINDIMNIMKNGYHKEYARSTIATFVQRLTEKGFLSSYRSGRTTYVHAIRNEQKYREEILSQMQEFWFGGDMTYLMSVLINMKRYSKNEIEKIRKILDEM